MGILQQPVQNKLSKLIGAEVRFEHLAVSILGGSIEARGLTVAGDDPAEPVLTVRRLRAEISIPRALKKEIVIKSLTIEAPVLSVVKHADGSTNLPKRITAPAGDDGDAHPPAPASAERTRPHGDDHDADAGGAWKLEAQRVLLVDGAVRYHADAPAGGEPLDFAADQILAEVTSAAGGLDFTCIVDALGRRGAAPADLGQLKFAGRAEGVEDLSQLRRAKVTATLDLGDHLRAEVKVPSLDPIDATVDAHGAIDLAGLVPFLPAKVKAMLPAPGTGRFELTLKAGYDAAGLVVHDFSVRARDVRLKP